MSNVVLQQNNGVVKHVTQPIAMSQHYSSVGGVGAGATHHASMISSSQPSNTNSCSSSLRSSNVASSFNDDYECMELAANHLRNNNNKSQQAQQQKPPASKQSSSPSSSSFI